MKISLVVAASDNNVIGKDNQLLWHLPKDMKFFKDTTWAMPIVMGRKTFESIGSKPLPGRRNIILTKQPSIHIPDVLLAASIDEAIQIAESENYAEIFIIGGGQIYAAAMALANTIYMTRVHTTIEGDTYFPILDAAWKLAYSIPFTADEKHAYSFDIECWNRP